MTTRSVALVADSRERRDPRVASAFLLTSAGALTLLGTVTYTIYINTQMNYGSESDRLLAQTLGSLSVEAVAVGFLGLASLILIWFAGAAGSVAPSGHGGVGLTWANGALGALVVACGLAGVAGAGLSATLPAGDPAWYLVQGFSSAIGSTLLGVAVVVSAAARVGAEATPGVTE